MFPQALSQKKVCEAPSKDHIHTNHFGSRKDCIFSPPFSLQAILLMLRAFESTITNIFVDHTQYLNTNSGRTSPFQPNRKDVKVVVKFLIFLYLTMQEAHTHTHVCVFGLLRTYLENTKIHIFQILKCEMYCSHAYSRGGENLQAN